MIFSILLLTPAIMAAAVPNQASGNYQNNAGEGSTGTGFAGLFSALGGSGAGNFGFNPASLIQSLGVGQWPKNADNIGASLKATNDIIPEMTYFVKLINDVNFNQQRPDFNSPNFAQETLQNTLSMMEPAKRIVLAQAEADGTDPTKQLRNIAAVQTHLPPLFAWLQQINNQNGRTQTQTQTQTNY